MAEAEDGERRRSRDRNLKGSRADGRSSDRCRRFISRKFRSSSRVTRFGSRNRPGSRKENSRDLSNVLGSNRRSWSSNADRGLRPGRAFGPHRGRSRKRNGVAYSERRMSDRDYARQPDYDRRTWRSVQPAIQYPNSYSYDRRSYANEYYQAAADRAVAANLLSGARS